MNLMHIPVYLLQKISRHGAAIERLTREIEPEDGVCSESTYESAISFDAADYVWAFLAHGGQDWVADSRALRNRIADSIAATLYEFRMTNGVDSSSAEQPES